MVKIVVYAIITFFNNYNIYFPEYSGDKEQSMDFEERRASIEKKCAARTRLELLFDQGSFVEVGTFVTQKPVEFGTACVDEPESVITGYGSVNGYLTFAFAQNSDISKGAVSEMSAKKICAIADMAVKAGAPLVAFLDSCGVLLSEGMDALAGYASVISKLNAIKGKTTFVAVVCGVCSGAMSFAVSNADYTITTEKGCLFLSSPDVIKARFNQEGDKFGFDCSCTDDSQAADKAREYISFLWDSDVSDDLNREVPELAGGVAASEIAKAVSDSNKCLVYGDCKNSSIFTALIKLNGRTIGVVANNGLLNGSACRKASRFVSFCERISVPVLTVCDTDGFSPDTHECIGACSSLVNAYMNASVPKVTLISGKAYGAGYVTMCPKACADIVYAFPTAQIACLSAETGAVFMMSQRLENSDHPVEDRNAIIEEYRTTLASPYEAARRGYVDDIIDPKYTRQLLISAFEMLA